MIRLTILCVLIAYAAARSITEAESVLDTPSETISNTEVDEEIPSEIDTTDDDEDETRKGCCRFSTLFSTSTAAPRPFTQTTSLLLVLNSMTIQGRQEQAEDSETNFEI